MAEKPKDDEFVKRSNLFLDWLQRNGTKISPKISLADLRDRNAGRGVVANEDLEEDEELFSIPNSSILTFETSSIPTEFKSDLADPWLLLILAMVYEFRRGAESEWRAYFDVLPEAFDTLMYWTEAELEYLEGSAVVGKIGKEGANSAFNEQLIPIIRVHEAAFRAEDVTDAELLELCHRMGSTIMAYAFDLESSAAQPNTGEDGWEEDSESGDVLAKGMIPLADMLNADADRNNAKLYYEDDRVVMKTIKTVGNGEELFNDYGPLPRSDLLRRYGYMSDNYAQYDVVELTLDLISKVAQEVLKMERHEVESRLEYLEEEGAVDDGFDISRASNGNEPFSDELKVVLNALAMPKEDFDKVKKKNKLPRPELSKEAMKLLYGILLQRRSVYPKAETLSQQRHAASGLSQNGHPTEERTELRKAMAADVINGEKDVLHEAAKLVQELLGDEKKRKADDFGEEALAHRVSPKKQKAE